MKSIMKSQNIYDYIILGGGITGISSGRRLQQLNNDNFLILESENETGGLCRTKTIDGHYLDIGGLHVLFSKYEDVLDWIYQHIPKEDFNEFDTKIMIDLEGYEIQFPIELNLWQLPTDLQIEYLYSYINAASKDVPYENFESWIKNYLGSKIADNYMIPYNQKLWCMDISKLNTDWLVKIPKTDIKLILRTIIEKKSNFSDEVVSHKSFLYPKYGGFQSVFNSIKKHVDPHIITNYKVESLVYLNDKKLWMVNNSLYCKNIINTIPWPNLNITLNGFNFKDEFENLEYLSNVVSLWEREPYTHDAHWKYIPNSDVEHHREFYLHNFAPYSKEGGVSTDINRKRWIENNKKWKSGTPLYEHENIFSYPLPTKTYKESIQKILDYCKDYNLYGLGRWGQWRYFNSDQCIKQVLEFFKEENQNKYFEIF